VTDVLWKRATTTVGLVVVGDNVPMRFNVMAAEWTYFVAKDPLHVAVVLCEGTFTRHLLESASEFSVTLCSAGQAALADFAGSFSGRDIDKTTSEDVVLGQPSRTQVPWVTGGLAGLECVTRQRVLLPGYLMVIGEVVAEHTEHRQATDPLVKHGRMYSLGPELPRERVVAAAEFQPSPTPVLRVAATGPTNPVDAPWFVTLDTLDGGSWPLGSYGPNEYGDLLVDIDLDLACADGLAVGGRVTVERAGLKPGHATVPISSKPPRQPD
jgi:flavin reductase (DIM6/NTAB) family NADH-FMN oxidoreductase RutF